MIPSSTLTLGLQSALLLAIAASVTWLLRRSNAALRHYIWTLALAFLLVLPFWPVQSFRVPVPIAQSAATRIVVTADGSRLGPSAIDAATVLRGLWMGGVLLLLARMAGSQFRGWRLARTATVWQEDAFLSSSIAVPMVVGLSAPKILLPLDAVDWEPERLEAVLAHERMHVLRRDLFWKFLAQIACAAYWPNPLVWFAARQHDKECEQSCDDGVLLSGVRATDYAKHLVSIARNLRAGPQLEGGLSMATTSTLERRLTALLNPLTSHKPLTRGTLLTTAALSLALLAPIAGWNLVAQTMGGTNGMVVDPSGAPIADARVTLVFPAGSNDRREITRTHASGDFHFPALPEGVYTLRVESPGFGPLEQAGLLLGKPGEAPIRITLNVGGIRESVQVSAVPGPASEPKQIRVGGNIQATKLVSQVRPLYPADCRTERVQGTVLLNAVIGVDGSIVSLKPINEFVDVRLRDTAIDSVKQWRYTPTLLNGNPIEVATVIEVNFTLSR
ncbi:M56 family metallopeptidase [Bryobacter aggregatus]|uniref:M56 family metallopeptidase n=1 Tax=Bryobacter aggregatus TaxID=360054 RepID=UPI00068A005E|nr:M56 family metallopeptidase [Bryobacter aggregatus]